MITPILMLGAGRMGGAMVEGWLRAGAFAAGSGRRGGGRGAQPAGR
jgi:hypothetical protein